MFAIPRALVQEHAQRAIVNMGDVFWDRPAHDDTAGEYSDPVETASSSIQEAVLTMIRAAGGRVVDTTGSGASAGEQDLAFARLSDLAGLPDEYATLIGQSERDPVPDTEFNRDQIIATLVSEADWTHRAAEHLVELVETYGSFVLRNATALAIVLGKEDGSARI